MFGTPCPGGGGVCPPHLGLLDMGFSLGTTPLKTRRQPLASARSLVVPALKPCHRMDGPFLWAPSSSVSGGLDSRRAGSRPVVSEPVLQRVCSWWPDSTAEGSPGTVSGPFPCGL